LTTRREFAAGLLLAAGPRSAWAQAPAQPRRIVLVFAAGPRATWRENQIWQRFFSELRRLGYVEGGNLVVEVFSAGGHFERHADVARQALSRNPDVIVAQGDPLVVVLRSATSTIPIVAIMVDPLDSGLVASLARRPGDNLTGVSIDAGVEIWGKRLDILKQAVPSASRIGILGTQLRPPNQPQLLQEAGKALGISLAEIYLSEVTAPEIERSFATLAEQQPDAVVISPEGEFSAHHRLIVELAERHRLPAMYNFRSFVEAGGLMAYAPDISDLGRQLADDVRQIFDGAEPGDIPIYQATKFELIINLKTANALGLTLPRSLLLLADEVIE
jgi:putative ABC transport system substrate-binding protein